MKTVPEALAELASHEEIGVFLFDQGITGFPRNPVLCPVATYLKRECDPERKRDLYVSTIDVTEHDPVQGDVYHPLPERVREFIAKYDRRDA